MLAGKCGKANQSSDGTLPPDSEAAVLVGRSLQGVAREWNTNGVKTVRDRAAALRARQDELATLFGTGEKPRVFIGLIGLPDVAAKSGNLSLDHRRDFRADLVPVTHTARAGHRLEACQRCACVCLRPRRSRSSPTQHRDVGVQRSRPFDDVADRVDDDVGA